jgi:hypothetical protein
MSSESGYPESSFQKALEAAGRPPQLPECFQEWLENYWLDNSDSEAEDLWVDTVRSEWWSAAAALTCVSAVLRDPPPNLVEIIRDRSRKALRNETSPGYFEKASYDDHVTWLQTRYDRFSVLLARGTAHLDDATSTEPSPEASQADDSRRGSD